MECCDYEDEYIYSDDEYYDYTDEESEDEFLDTTSHSTSDSSLCEYNGSP